MYLILTLFQIGPEIYEMKNKGIQVNCLFLSLGNTTSLCSAGGHFPRVLCRLKAVSKSKASSDSYYSVAGRTCLTMGLTAGVSLINAIEDNSSH